MSNKYEREIEEILRNLERTDPKAGGKGIKQRGSGRRKVATQRSLFNLRLSFSEWCLIVACLAALAGGGWAYAHANTGDLVTGLLALVGIICIAIVAISPFVARPYPSSSRRYNNVTPLRRNPFSRVATSWNLMMLKLRYRRRRDHE
jgi:hypothetical protein